MKTKSKSKKKASVESISNQLKNQLTSFHNNLSEAMQSSSLIKFVVSKNGIMEVRSNEIGTFITKADKIAGAEDIQESFSLKLPKKIPYRMFLEILTFFREVDDLYSGAEAALQVFWNESEQEYFIYCPEQTVNKATVNFKRNPELEQSHLLVLDVHSHNSMGAFFSATDNSDEKETRLFGVFGKIDTDTPEFKFRAVCGGKTIESINVWDIFENPYENVEVPKEWFDMVSKPKPKTVLPKKTGYNYGHSYNQNGLFDEYDYYGSYYGSNTTAYKSKSSSKVSVKEEEEEDNFFEEMEKYKKVDTVLQSFTDDEISLLVERLADEGYDSFMETALYSREGSR